VVGSVRPVVFVRRPPGRSGSTKIQIAERRDGRDVVVEQVGTGRTEAELAVLMAAARRRVHEGQETLDLEVAGLEDEGVPQRPGLITSKRSAVLWQVLSDAYARLGSRAERGRRAAGITTHDVQIAATGTATRLPRPDRHRLLQPRRHQRRRQPGPL